MSRFSGPESRRTKPSSNVYTALLFIAFIAVSVAAGVLWQKNVELTSKEQEAKYPGGTFKNPFFVVDQSNR